MKHLLAIEWLKIKRYRTFWILMGIFSFMLVFWNYGVSSGFMKFGAGSVNILSQAYSFSAVWGNVGFWASIFVIFLSILTIIITTNEYQYKTNRQNVIDGWSRLQFYHAKWLVVLALSIFTTLFVFITGLGFGLATTGCFCGFPGDIEKLFYVFILSLNYYGFGLLIALLFKRSGIAIGMFFLYCMFLETLLKSLINWKLDYPIGNFMPLQASDELLPLPLMEMAKKMLVQSAAPSNTTYIIVSLCWIFIYYLTGRQRLLRSDW
ncbi:ABC transporter permease [Chitinophagaceae bacterium MMS25-I14]